MIKKDKMKQILINAIIGKGFTSENHVVAMEKMGLLGFSGNPWEMNWGWKINALNQLNNKELEKIYDVIHGEEIEKNVCNENEKLKKDLAKLFEVNPSLVGQICSQMKNPSQSQSQ